MSNYKMEINQCPFCAEKEELKIFNIPAFKNYSQLAFIECQKCAARGPVVIGENVDYCKEKAEKEAVKYWNKRQIEKKESESE